MEQDPYLKYPDLRVVEEEGHHRLQTRKAVLGLAPHNGVGAEIGVFTGIFSEVLLETVPAQKFFMVDPWTKLHGERYPNWGRYTAEIALEAKAAKSAAEFRAKRLPVECEVVEDFGDVWLKQFEAPFLDWVYLDANHKFEAVLEDLHAIDSCLNLGGVIMGDDAWVRQGQRSSDVYFAIKRFCQEKAYDLVFLDGYGQWALKRSDEVECFGVPWEK